MSPNVEEGKNYCIGDIMQQKVLRRTELAEKLKQDIYLKELQVGDRIGSIRRLAMRYHTTPLTVNRTLNALVEEQILYRDENGCCRIMNAPPVKPRLGYAGEPILPSGNLDCLMQDAVRKLFNELDKLNSSPQIIGYHELCNPEIAMQRLKNINGLIVHDSFFDDNTCEVLNKLNIPIVRIGQALPKYSAFSSSEVVQFFDPALKEFAQYCKLESYKKIFIVHTSHWNSAKLAREIRHFLHNCKLDNIIETVTLDKAPWNNAELQAFCFFQQTDKSMWDDSLIISLSGYFSRGICRALSGKGELPDILSIDNLDSYEKCSFFGEPYLTAIDRNMGRIFREAARLIYDQVKSGDERKVIIKIPAKLAIRKSIRHINPNWSEK